MVYLLLKKDTPFEKNYASLLNNYFTSASDEVNLFGKTLSEISNDKNYSDTVPRHKESFEISNSDTYSTQHDDSPINVPILIAELNNVDIPVEFLVQGQVYKICFSFCIYTNWTCMP